VLSVHRLVPRPGIRRRVVELLDQVGLPPSAADLHPADFSGGQRQRICIARALAAEPEVLIADEPVSSLDVSIRAQVLNLLLDLRERLGLAIILIGHDLLLVGAIAPRIAVMLGGQIVELLPRGIPLAAARHPYTRELLAAVRRLEPGAKIGSAPATPTAAMPARGCSYWPRCPYRGDPRCESQTPPLREIAPGHRVASFYDLPEARQP
jgi:peptide/nickel transport system ATP-binding protein